MQEGVNMKNTALSSLEQQTKHTSFNPADHFQGNRRRKLLRPIGLDKGDKAAFLQYVEGLKSWAKSSVPGTDTSSTTACALGLGIPTSPSTCGDPSTWAPDDCHQVFGGFVDEKVKLPIPGAHGLMSTLGTQLCVPKSHELLLQYQKQSAEMRAQLFFRSQNLNRDQQLDNERFNDEMVQNVKSQSQHTQAFLYHQYVQQQRQAQHQWQNMHAQQLQQMMQAKLEHLRMEQAEIQESMRRATSQMSVPSLTSQQPNPEATSTEATSTEATSTEATNAPAVDLLPSTKAEGPPAASAEVAGVPTPQAADAQISTTAATLTGEGESATESPKSENVPTVTSEPSGGHIPQSLPVAVLDSPLDGGGEAEVEVLEGDDADDDDEDMDEDMDEDGDDADGDDADGDDADGDEDEEDLEEQRLKTIRKNQEMLLKLGLAGESKEGKKFTASRMLLGPTREEEKLKERRRLEMERAKRRREESDDEDNTVQIRRSTRLSAQELERQQKEEMETRRNRAAMQEKRQMEYKQAVLNEKRFAMLTAMQRADKCGPQEWAELGQLSITRQSHYIEYTEQCMVQLIETQAQYRSKLRQLIPTGKANDIIRQQTSLMEMQEIQLMFQQRMAVYLSQFQNQIQLQQHWESCLMSRAQLKKEHGQRKYIRKVMQQDRDEDVYDRRHGCKSLGQWMTMLVRVEETLLEAEKSHHQLLTKQKQLEIQLMTRWQDIQIQQQAIHKQEQEEHLKYMANPLYKSLLQLDMPIPDLTKEPVLDSISGQPSPELPLQADESAMPKEMAMDQEVARLKARRTRMSVVVSDMVETGLLSVGAKVYCRGHHAVVSDEHMLSWTFQGKRFTSNVLRLFAEGVGDRSKRCWHSSQLEDGTPMVRLRDKYLDMLENKS